MPASISELLTVRRPVRQKQLLCSRLSLSVFHASKQTGGTRPTCRGAAVCSTLKKTAHNRMREKCVLDAFRATVSSTQQITSACVVMSWTQSSVADTTSQNPVILPALQDTCIGKCVAAMISSPRAAHSIFCVTSVSASNHGCKHFSQWSHALDCRTPA